MTPEALEKLQEVLKQIVIALYDHGGEKWCQNMIALINELDTVGKP